MAEVRTELPVIRGLGETTRPDRWWVQPLVVLSVLSAFVLYATWAGMQNNNYTYGPYLSPFYSPVLLYDTNGDNAVQNAAREHHAWFGEKPTWWPWFIPFSPAALILIAPAGFRLTCYYYRGAYYKAFVADPPSCAVGEGRTSYNGERGFLSFQNLHRYFLYLALIFLVILAYDAWSALWFPVDPTDWSKGTTFGVGVGTFVLTLNVYLLGGYTLGCHSLRHLVGGGKDQLAGSAIKPVYDCVSCLNRRHPYWAWASLIWVGFTDVYIRLCSMGVWSDWRIL